MKPGRGTWWIHTLRQVERNGTGAEKSHQSLRSEYPIGSFQSTTRIPALNSERVVFLECKAYLRPSLSKVRLDSFCDHFRNFPGVKARTGGDLDPTTRSRFLLFSNLVLDTSYVQNEVIKYLDLHITNRYTGVHLSIYIYQPYTIGSSDFRWKLRVVRRGDGLHSSRGLEHHMYTTNAFFQLLPRFVSPSKRS